MISVQYVPVSVTWLILLLLIARTEQAAIRAKTNSMRYARSEDSSSKGPSIDQVIDMMAPANTKLTQKDNNYRMNKILPRKHLQRLLDEEDQNLLEEFYRTTRERDPFLDGSLSAESLWDSQELAEDALLDAEPSDMKTKYLASPEKHDGWTFESKLADPASKQVISQVPLVANWNQSNYSPTLKLLTSYDPTEEMEMMSGRLGKIRRNRIVGATVYGRDQNSRPLVGSKSAVDAVRLHDDLLKDPPRDGKVRVRMYYHRAIHDDAKLYGTGPWKYWGHGWGVEFGYDPKSSAADKFYQRGYTIERAFGRDFCKDPRNCRQPDPEFFTDPKDVGKYTRQFAKTVPMVNGYRRGQTQQRQRNW